MRRNFFWLLLLWRGGDYLVAEIYLTGLLVRQPDQHRIKLELARAYFFQEKDREAEQLFREVLKEAPPQAVSINIRTFLDQVEKRKPVRWNLAFSLVPDSNFNAATNDEYVSLYGIPFELSEEARNKSGIGAKISGGVDARLRRPGGEALLGEFQVVHTEQMSSSLDDTFVFASVGRSSPFLRGEIGGSLIGSTRWYAHDLYSYGTGISLTAAQALWSSTVLVSRLLVQRQRFPDHEGLNGYYLGLTNSLDYKISPFLTVRKEIGVALEKTEDEAFSNYDIFILSGIEKAWRDSLMVSLQVTGGIREYNAPMAAFGKARSDFRVGTVLAFQHYRFQWNGFTPTFRVLLNWNFSNIDYYDYKRRRLELQFSRLF